MSIHRGRQGNTCGEGVSANYFFRGGGGRNSHQGAPVEYFVTTRMAATRIGFSRPAGFDWGLRNSGHLWKLRESISCFVSCGFRLQCGGCTSRAQNLKFRAQNLHRSDPQRSRTPKLEKALCGETAVQKGVWRVRFFLCPLKVFS